MNYNIKMKCNLPFFCVALINYSLIKYSFLNCITNVYSVEAIQAICIMEQVRMLLTSVSQGKGV